MAVKNSLDLSDCYSYQWSVSYSDMIFLKISPLSDFTPCGWIGEIGRHGCLYLEDILKPKNWATLCFLDSEQS